MALSKKKQLFVNEYLKSFNATKAAQAAGYSGNNNVMAQRGYELVRNSDIAELIRDRLQESAMSANEVLMRLAEQARAQYSCYLGSDGHVDLEGLLADGKGHLIKGIKETKYGRQIEFYDSQSALNLLAKHHGLLTDRVEQINLEVDLNTLSNEQISRLANGESLTDVLGG
jgi:phage terminase small subunit